jgi:hypothetical protein
MMNAAADFYWTDAIGSGTLVVHHPTIAHKEALMTKQTTDATFTRLRELHQEYVEKVGHLMTDDREDLVPEAIAGYADEALRELDDGEAA